MSSWLGRAVHGVMVAALIIALATLGGFRLGSSASSVRGHVSLAQTGGSFRTWVSGTGTDMLSCGRASPCPTFAVALTKVAPSGEVDAADAGEFGGFMITHAITIDGLGGGKAGISTSGGPGIVVQAGPNDVVTLRHLQIQGLGPGTSLAGTQGIRFLSGKALILDDVVVEGYSQNGVDVELTTPGKLTIINSRIYDNGGAGVAISDSGGSVQASISHSELADNYYGLIAQDGANVKLANSVVDGNTSIGVGCQTFGNLACTIQTTRDQLDHNWAAIWMNHGSGNAQITETLSDDDVSGDTYGIYGDFGGTLNAASFSNNRFVNNFLDGTASSSSAMK